MLKILYAGYLDLSLAILAQFTPKLCVETQNNQKKFTKTPNFGGSKSFKVIDVDKTIKPVTSSCYDKQHGCTYLQLFSH